MNSKDSLKQQIASSLNAMWEHGFKCGINQQQGWKAEYEALKKSYNKLVEKSQNLWTLVDLDIGLDVVQEFKQALEEAEAIE